MPIYSADQIVGKSLFAKVPIELKRTPVDSATVIYTVSPGQRVGTVYSWNDVKPGVRENLYWMFYDQNNKPYYAEHKEGYFDIDSIKEQGGLTVKEQIEAEQRKNEDTKTFIERMVKYGFLILAGTVVVKTLIAKK